eukprot:382791_1
MSSEKTKVLFNKAKSEYDTNTEMLKDKRKKLLQEKHRLTLDVATNLNETEISEELFVRDTADLMHNIQSVLSANVFTDKEIDGLLLNTHSKLFFYSCICSRSIAATYLNTTLQVVGHYKNDKKKFLKLVNILTAESINTNQLHLNLNGVWQNRSKETTQLLKVILNHPLLTYEDKMKVFILNQTSAVLISKYGLENNLLTILEYFNFESGNKKHSLQLLLKLNYTEFNSTELVLEIFELYFDRNNLLKVLQYDDVFETICTQHKHIKILQYILYDSPLNNKDIHNVYKKIRNKQSIFNDVKNIQNGIELLNYYQNDKNALLRLLTDTNAINICKKHICVAQLILNNECINESDKCALFNIRKFRRNDMDINLLIKVIIYQNQNDMEMLFARVKNNELIQKLINFFDAKSVNVDTKLLWKKWGSYFKWEQVLQEVGCEEFDISCKSYGTNPFIAACRFQKIQTIKVLIKNIKRYKNKSGKLMKLLSATDVDEIGEITDNALMIIVSNDYHKLLNLTLLDDELISEEQKCKLLSMKINDKNDTILMIATNDSRLLMLKSLTRNSLITLILNDNGAL